MKPLKTIFAVLALAAALGLPVYAGDVSFSIRYFDKRIYHLAAEPILVQITITNNSPESYRFKLAEDRAFSLDFSVRTAANRAVPAADRLIRKRASDLKVFFREVSIEKDESFSFVEDLRDYVNLNASGSYVVQARIYPELYRAAPAAAPGAAFLEAAASGAVSAAGASAAAVPETRVLESNRLGLVVRPPVLPGPEGVEMALDEETNEILVREKLPPDEVVAYTIQARQRSQWPKFFLYLDLESLLVRDPVRQRQWRTESEEGRLRMIARYREELQRATVGEEIAVIPYEFTIERTEYGSAEGTVVALEKFRYPGFTEKKRFTYYLYRKNEIWTIVDYEVSNLGTE